MKTSVTMTRRMGAFEVQQRTKDGYFDANDLLRLWNSTTDNKRKMANFINSPKTAEFVNEIIADSQREKTELPNNQAFIIVKSKTDKKGKKTHDKVWMHPFLFIDFAMWINPTFKLQVIKFVHDQLMEFRNESGDLTKELNSSVQRFDDINYPQLAKGLNHIVYGRHEKGIRNTGTEDQTKTMVDLQKKLAFSCDMGYIKSFDQLLEEMRRIWAIKAI